MPSNHAAYITAAKAHPFEVKPAPIGTPSSNQILIKNHALAINPVDGKIQQNDLFSLPYPTILGQDMAGEVISVGPDVTRFQPGDRVVGLGTGFFTHKTTDMAFQEYTVVQTNMACAIPEGMAYETAVVLPLGLSTAASVLFQKDFFGLQTPTCPARESTGKTLLIWGGASSVGSCAIQLAVAAGYEVVTTASPKNFEYVKRLGASHVFDYKSESVVADLLEVFKGKDSLPVFDCIGEGAWTLPIEFAQKNDGPKFVATVTDGFPDVEGIRISHTFALSISVSPVGKAIFEDFLPEALKSGAFVAVPEPMVVGHGLESLQKGVDILNKGVSAKKVVVML